MGLSTFCRYALQSQRGEEHNRCSGINCECECHTNPKVVRRPALACPERGCTKTYPAGKADALAKHVMDEHNRRVTDYPPVLPTVTRDEVPAAASDHNWETFTAKGTRRRRPSRPETERRAICEEYAAAAVGEKPEVLARHKVSTSTINRWMHDLEIPVLPLGGPRPGSGPGRNSQEANVSGPVEPENVETFEPAPLIVNQVISPPDDDGVAAFTFTPEQEDVLNAMAFLEGSDPMRLLHSLVCEAVDTWAAEPDIRQLVELRQAWRARAEFEL